MALRIENEDFKLDIVSQLTNMGVGSVDECHFAYKQVGGNNINDVLDWLFQNKITKSNKSLTDCINYKNMDSLSILLQNKHYLSQINDHQLSKIQNVIINKLFGGFRGLLNIMIKPNGSLTTKQQCELNKILTKKVKPIYNVLRLTDIPEDLLSFTMTFLDNHSRGTLQYCSRSLAIIIRRPSSMNNIKHNLISLIGSNYYIPTIISYISSYNYRDNIEGIKLFNKHIKDNKTLLMFKNYDVDILNTLIKIMNNYINHRECQQAVEHIMSIHNEYHSSLLPAIKYILENVESRESAILDCILDAINIPGFLHDILKCHNLLRTILGCYDIDNEHDSVQNIIKKILQHKIYKATYYMLDNGLLDILSNSIDANDYDEDYINDTMELILKQNLSERYIDAIISCKKLIDFIIAEQDYHNFEEIMKDILKQSTYDQKIRIVTDYNVSDEMIANVYIPTMTSFISSNDYNLNIEGIRLFNKYIINNDCYDMLEEYDKLIVNKLIKITKYKMDKCECQRAVITIIEMINNCPSALLPSVQYIIKNSELHKTAALDAILSITNDIESVQDMLECDGFIGDILKYGYNTNDDDGEYGPVPIIIKEILIHQIQSATYYMLDNGLLNVLCDLIDDDYDVDDMYDIIQLMLRQNLSDDHINKFISCKKLMNYILTEITEEYSDKFREIMINIIESANYSQRKQMKKEYNMTSQFMQIFNSYNEIDIDEIYVYEEKTENNDNNNDDDDDEMPPWDPSEDDDDDDDDDDDGDGWPDAFIDRFVEEEEMKTNGFEAINVFNRKYKIGDEIEYDSDPQHIDDNKSHIYSANIIKIDGHIGGRILLRNKDIGSYCSYKTDAITVRFRQQ